MVDTPVRLDRGDGGEGVEVTDRYSAVLYSAPQAHTEMARAWAEFVKPKLSYAAIDGVNVRFTLEIRPETRSDAQNRLMWSCLNDISRQVDWYGKKLAPEDWKHVFTASLRKLAVVPNLDGTGFVALGLSTSRMTKAEMTELIDLAHAFGDERGVQWSPTSIGEEMTV